MEEREHFFISESIEHARELPLRDCIKYLKGFLMILGDHPAKAAVNTVCETLSSTDQQLDLIQIGQLKLALGSPKSKKDGK